MVLNPNAVPGIGATRTATPRKLLLTEAGARYIPGGKVIDGALSRDPGNTGDVDVLRAGLVMGMVTASGKFAPSVLGVLQAAYDKDTTGGGALQLSVGAACATEIVRRIDTTGTFKLTGPPSAAGTVVVGTTVTYSAVNTTTGMVTISLLGADYIAGSWVQPTDGSEAPLAMIPDMYGLKVTDEDSVNLASVEFAKALIGGTIDTSQVINIPSDTSLKRWLKAAINGHTVLDGASEVQGPFLFDDKYDKDE